LTFAARAYKPYFLWPGVVLAAVSGFYMSRDIAHYDQLTPDRIVTVDYWTSKPRAHRYEDVTAITVECAKYSTYSLLLRSRDEVTIKFSVSDQARLDALTAIDERLRQMGVKAEFDIRTPLFRSPVIDYSEACVADLVDGLVPARAAQIERIMHLDDWRGRP
jgi:hypothetical protein